jgi:hypothetical protein
MPQTQAGHLALVLETDAELAQLDDGRSAPAGCVGREGQHERHPVFFPERLAVAEDAVVPWRRFDGQAYSLESADEFANVLPHLEPTLQRRLVLRCPSVEAAGIRRNVRRPRG